MWLLHSSLFIGLSKVSRSKCLVYYVIKTIRPLYVDITTCFNSILYNLPTTLLSHVTSIKPWFVTYYGLMWISFVFYWAYFLFTLIWSWIIHCNEPQSYLEQNVFSWKTGVDSKHILLFRYWLYTYSLYPVHGQQVYVPTTGNRNLLLLQSQRPSSIGGLSQAKSRAGAPDQCETKKDNSEIPEIPTSENMGVRRASLDEWRSSSGKPSLLTQSSLKSDIQDVMSNIKKQSNQG